MIAALVLSAFAILFVWSAIRRYRSDSRMLIAGLVSAAGGVGGIALGVPQIVLHSAHWMLVTLGLVAVICAIGGCVYAERRYRLLELDRARSVMRRTKSKP